MNRQLTKQEKQRTSKVVNKQKEHLANLKEALEMKRLLVEKIIPYNRRMENKRNNEELEILKEDIKQTEFAIENAEKQIKDGVEVKIPRGV